MNLNQIDSPTTVNLLVAFADLSKFVSLKSKMNDLETCKLLSDFYEMTGDVVSSSGGTVIKFIGDAGLIVFPEEKVSEGILALNKLKNSIDDWMVKQGLPCRLIVKSHFGPVVCAPLGTKDDKRLDVIGNTVNAAAMLAFHGFAMTPETFRKLSPEARKPFKKHTPPVRYIPINEHHKD